MAKVRDEFPGAITITTNGGIDLIDPDYYFIHHAAACNYFLDAAKAKQQAGTSIVTTVYRGKPPRGYGYKQLIKRGCEPNVILDVHRFKPPRVFERGIYTDFAFSGLYCPQVAINFGAKKLLVVGHEGYPATHDEPHYWHPDFPTRLPEGIEFQRTHAIIQPFWQSAIDACPDVEFVFCGDLLYPVTGNNVEVRS